MDLDGRCGSADFWGGGADGCVRELAHMVDAIRRCVACVPEHMLDTHARCYANASWWGGDGVRMVTFGELADMVDAIRRCVACAPEHMLHTHARYYANASWWGGDGVFLVTFGELAHMVDPTQLCCLCPDTCHGGAGMGWEGSLHFVNLHTWWMLRRFVACFCRHMFDAPLRPSWWGGDDVVWSVTFGELAHMVDAMQLCCLCLWAHARCYANAPRWGGDGYVR